jgi:hypothetical protein
LGLPWCEDEKQAWYFARYLLERIEHNVIFIDIVPVVS